MKTPTEPASLLDPKQNALPVNLDGFREAADGDESERIDLLKMYAGQLSQKLQQARASFEKKDLSQVARVLHSLTGATFTCGLAEFGAALRALEESAKVGNATGVIAMVLQIIDHAKRIDAAIATEIARCNH